MQRDQTNLVDMAEILKLQGRDPLTLTQKAGPGAGRTFRVLPLQEITIGRGENCDISIDEGSVSRVHARIQYADTQPRLIDNDSTNGTYVNGRKVTRANLSSGDVLQVGSIQFEILIAAAPERDTSRGSHDPAMQRRISRISERLRSHTDSGRRHETVLAGNLRELGLLPLLQILETNSNSGVLVIKTSALKGEVFLDDGRPVHARFGRIKGAKALYRLVALEEGAFELVCPGSKPEEISLRGSLQSFLLDAVKEIDEFAVYRKELPGDDAKLTFCPNRTIFLDRVPPDLFDVLAAVCRHQRVGAIIEECHLSDLTVCRTLLMLLREKIVEVREGEE